MVQSAISVADRESAARAVLAAGQGVTQGAGSDLLGLFSLAGDGRSGQGRDHPVAAVLVLAAAAVGAGMKGYTAIAGWVKDVPPPVLADLYLQAGAGAALGQIDLNGTIVTAGALHTVKGAAGFICEHGGEFMLPVKENRQALFEGLDALPRDQVPVAHSATDRGHGRVTTRTIQVMRAAEDLPFPHVTQVLLMERYVSDLAGNRLPAVAALGVASPSPDRATPAGLARYVRGQWAIESLHWLRSPGAGLAVASCGANATRVSFSC